MTHKELEWSEEEKAYLLYEHSLAAERMELTWHEWLEQAKAELKCAQQENEQLRQEKEHERQEKERLRALLLKAGIDPS